MHNDLAEVTGAVTVDGTSMVQVRAENGTDDGASYAPDTTYTILTATGGVSGMFNSTVDENFAFLDAALAYDPDAVYLTLKRNNLSFASVGTTPNQQAAATGLSGFASSDPVYQQIVAQSAADAQRSFDLASGEVHASGQHVIEQSFALFAGSLDQGQGVVIDQTPPALTPLAYGPSANTAVASLLAVDAATAMTTPTHSAWLSPLAGRGTIDGDGNAAQLDWWSAGLAGGYEVSTALAGGEGRFGLGLGYLKGGADIPDRLSSLSSEGGYAGLYGQWNNGPLSLSGSLAYGASEIRTRRDILIGSINRTASTDYWNHSVGASLEAAYGFALTDSFTVSPLGTLDVSWSGHDGATETGADGLNAIIDPASAWRLDTGLGLELAYGLALENGGSVTLTSRALWQHGFGDTTPEQAITLAGGGPGFTVAGPNAGRDRLQFGAGIAWSPAAAASLSLDYAATIAANQTSHTAQASVKIGF